MSNSVSRSFQRRIALALALGAIGLATGCASIPSRVWYNGQAMSSTWQYRDVLNGDRSPDKLRALYYQSDARLLGHRSVRYPYFGRW